MHCTAWSKGLDVTAGGQGIVSHAGLVLLRQRADLAGQRSHPLPVTGSQECPGLQPRAPYGPVKA